MWIGSLCIISLVEENFDNYNLFDEIIIEMNKKLMKLDERKRNFPPIITVSEALMNTIQRMQNDQLGSKLSFFLVKD